METDITKGLNQQQVAESRNRHGDNVLTPPEKASVWTQFLEKFKDPLIKILLVALVLSIGIACYEAFGLNTGWKAFLEPLGIFLAVTLATVIGFVIELNANKKFEMLNQMNDDAAVTVVRDGNITQVARRDIVVGDVVILETGDEVPADGNLVDSVSLSINESTLTGEPVIKKTHIEADFKKDATYPSNRALRGTTVTEGHGTMLVDAVGDATEYGKVYEAAQIDNGVKTPLTLQFERLGRLVSYASYTIGALIIVGRLCIYNYGAGFEWMSFIEYLLTTIMLAVTLIVVSVPEGLPMSVTLSLALSMRRMLATNNLVRKMHACETMGATTVICTDKTGTLTQNQMRIYETQFAALGKSQQLADNNESKLIAEAIAVNSTAFLDRGADRPTVVGNPTEGALLLWLNDQHTDYKPLRDNAAVTEQLPFSTMRKFMATVVDSGVCPGKRIAYVKGAPEIVIDKCRNFPDGVTKEQLREALLGYQQKAMRTLGFAYQEVGDGKAVKGDSLNADNLTFMGIMAISDPVRADVPAAVKESIDAGIKIKIVTGDTPGTAKEIGRQIGLWNDNTDNDSNIITGPDFAALDDNDAAEAARRIKIMSRARPTDKSRLVGLLQQQGEVVAVTGDGTNDAPALNAAQVGLSMGDGTSVAKEASDITIMDNSFASITRAVMWGRSLYQNIQRFILFQLTVNLVACTIVLIGAFTGQQSPLTVTQMLWVNLIMDAFAALSLASLPPNEAVMRNKPRRLNDFIINRTMKWFIIGVSAVFVVVLFGFMQYLKANQVDSLDGFNLSDFFASYLNFSNAEMNAYDVTMFFTFFVMLQFWNLFNAKSFESDYSGFSRLRDSKVFFLTAAIIIVGQVLIVNFGGEMLNVVPLGWKDWLRLIIASSAVVWIGELVHLVLRLKHKKA